MSTKRSLKKVLKKAQDLSRLAKKVYHYRLDVLTGTQVDELQSARALLTEAMEKPYELSSLESALSRMESVLENCGGTYYSKKDRSENIEMFLVAAILALGIRAFFIQPFKIPTNSMYPTYNGMTYELYESVEDKPNAVFQAFNFLTQLASRHSAVAPADGKLVVPIAKNGRGWNIALEGVKARSKFIFPTIKARCNLYVGGEKVSVDVPADFKGQLNEIVQKIVNQSTVKTLRAGRNGGYELVTDLEYKQGEEIFSFDILTGDQLFVDRFSYHFISPKVGESFVFKTDNIPGMSEQERGKFYIKRIAGAEGDVLKIEDPTLLINAKAADQADAFIANQEKEGEYEGYVGQNVAGPAMKYLSNGQEYTIPEDSFFALGDNSDASLDSRYWGIVPSTEVVGRPLFIYYPFTKRWGVAQ